MVQAHAALGKLAHSRAWLVGLILLALVLNAGLGLWHRSLQTHRQQGVGDQLAALARPGDIRMLGSVDCSVCAVARAWFKAHKVPYSECLIERDAACRAAFQAGGYAGTPVILVRGKVLLGFSPELVFETLHQRA
jgi:hypothetical protein